MAFSDIKDLTVEELNKRYKTTRYELFEMKMKHSMEHLANPMEIRKTRRNIARIKTALNQKLGR